MDKRGKDMNNLSKGIKTSVKILVIALLLITTIFLLSACKDKDKNNTTENQPPLYEVSFSGNYDWETYDIASTEWTESREQGFEAVYTLTGTVPYDKEFADLRGYTDGRVNFALIRFSSSKLNKVAYNEEDGTGFYAKITNFYGTDNEQENILNDIGFSSNEESSDYLLYQGVDNQVRTMIVEISFDGTKENARLYKFVIEPENYQLESDIYTLNFNGNIEGESYSVGSTAWNVSYEAGFDGVYTLVDLVPYDIENSTELGYNDGRVNLALIRFEGSIQKVPYDSDTNTGFYAEVTNYYGTDHAETSIRHDTTFSSGEDEYTFLFYQGIDNTVRTKTIKVSFDGTEENARIYKFIIDPANYTLEGEPMINKTEGNVEFNGATFANPDSFKVDRMLGTSYTVSGEVATMTTEQATAYWEGEADAGDKYIIITLNFEANSTIKYGYVQDASYSLGEVNDPYVKSFNSADNTSEDFIIGIGFPNARGYSMWKVEVTNVSGETISYTVDLSPLLSDGTNDINL